MSEDTKSLKNNMGVERRRFPRLNISANVEYAILDKLPLAEKKTLTKNISAGGICLIVYEKIELGTVLDLKIQLEDINYTIKTKGRAVWSSYFTLTSDSRPRYDLGIEFIDIEQSDRQKLSQHILTLIR